MSKVLDPTTLTGALVYGALFLLVAATVARVIRTSVTRLLAHKDH